MLNILLLRTLLPILHIPRVIPPQLLRARLPLCLGLIYPWKYFLVSLRSSSSPVRVWSFCTLANDELVIICCHIKNIACKGWNCLFLLRRGWLSLLVLLGGFIIDASDYVFPCIYLGGWVSLLFSEFPSLVKVLAVGVASLGFWLGNWVWKVIF